MQNSPFPAVGLSDTASPGQTDGGNKPATLIIGPDGSLKINATMNAEDVKGTPKFLMAQGDDGENRLYMVPADSKGLHDKAYLVMPSGGLGWDVQNNPAGTQSIRPILKTKEASNTQLPLVTKSVPSGMISAPNSNQTNSGGITNSFSLQSSLLSPGAVGVMPKDGNISSQITNVQSIPEQPQTSLFQSIVCPSTLSAMSSQMVLAPQPVVLTPTTMNQQSPAMQGQFSSLMLSNVPLQQGIVSPQPATPTQTILLPSPPAGQSQAIVAQQPVVLSTSMGSLQTPVPTQTLILSPPLAPNPPVVTTQSETMVQPLPVMLSPPVIEQRSQQSDSKAHSIAPSDFPILPHQLPPAESTSQTTGTIVLNKSQIMKNNVSDSETVLLSARKTESSENKSIRNSTTTSSVEMAKEDHSLSYLSSKENDSSSAKEPLRHALFSTANATTEMHQNKNAEVVRIPRSELVSSKESVLRQTLESEAQVSGLSLKTRAFTSSWTSRQEHLRTFLQQKKAREEPFDFEADCSAARLPQTSLKDKSEETLKTTNDLSSASRFSDKMTGDEGLRQPYDNTDGSESSDSHLSVRSDSSSSTKQSSNSSRQLNKTSLSGSDNLGASNEFSDNVSKVSSESKSNSVPEIVDSDSASDCSNRLEAFSPSLIDVDSNSPSSTSDSQQHPTADVGTETENVIVLKKRRMPIVIDKTKESKPFPLLLFSHDVAAKLKSHERFDRCSGLERPDAIPRAMSPDKVRTESENVVVVEPKLSSASKSSETVSAVDSSYNSQGPEPKVALSAAPVRKTVQTQLDGVGHSETPEKTIERPYAFAVSSTASSDTDTSKFVVQTTTTTRTTASVYTVAASSSNVYSVSPKTLVTYSLNSGNGRADTALSTASKQYSSVASSLSANALKLRSMLSTDTHSKQMMNLKTVEPMVSTCASVGVPAFDTRSSTITQMSTKPSVIIPTVGLNLNTSTSMTAARNVAQTVVLPSTACTPDKRKPKIIVSSSGLKEGNVSQSNLPAQTMPEFLYIPRNSSMALPANAQGAGLKVSQSNINPTAGTSTPSSVLVPQVLAVPSVPSQTMVRLVLTNVAGSSGSGPRYILSTNPTVQYVQVPSAVKASTEHNKPVSISTVDVIQPRNLPTVVNTVPSIRPRGKWPTPLVMPQIPGITPAISTAIRPTVLVKNKGIDTVEVPTGLRPTFMVKNQITNGNNSVSNIVVSNTGKTTVSTNTRSFAPTASSVIFPRSIIHTKAQSGGQALQTSLLKAGIKPNIIRQFFPRQTPTSASTTELKPKVVPMGPRTPVVIRTTVAQTDSPTYSARNLLQSIVDTTKTQTASGLPSIQNVSAAEKLQTQNQSVKGSSKGADILNILPNTPKVCSTSFQMPANSQSHVGKERESLKEPSSPCIRIDSVFSLSVNADDDSEHSDSTRDNEEDIIIPEEDDMPELICEIDDNFRPLSLEEDLELSPPKLVKDGNKDNSKAPGDDDTEKVVRVLRGRSQRIVQREVRRLKRLKEKKEQKMKTEMLLQKCTPCSVVLRRFDFKKTRYSLRYAEQAFQDKCCYNCIQLGQKKRDNVKPTSGTMVSSTKKGTVCSSSDSSQVLSKSMTNKRSVGSSSSDKVVTAKTSTVQNPPLYCSSTTTATPTINAPSLSSFNNVLKQLSSETSPPTSSGASNPQQKFFLIKVDNKNILIPTVNNTVAPRAYIMNNDSASTLAQLASSQGGRIQNSSVQEGLATVARRVLHPTTIASVKHGTSSLAVTSTVSTSAAIATLTSLSTSSSISSTGSQLTSNVRVKSEPVTTGYGDEKDVVKTPSFVIKEEPTNRGYADEVVKTQSTSLTTSVPPTYTRDQKSRREALRQISSHRESQTGERDSVNVQSKLQKTNDQNHDDRIRKLKEMLKEKERALEEIRRKRAGGTITEIIPQTKE